MNAKQVAVHEVDGRRMHFVFDGLADYVAVLGAEFAETGRVGVLGDLPPLRSHAYRTAAALLNVYRSRVDFRRHCAGGNDAASLRYQFAPMPALNGPAPAVTH
jgi:hypothetical protein